MYFVYNSTILRFCFTFIFFSFLVHCVLSILFCLLRYYIVFCIYFFFFLWVNRVLLDGHLMPWSDKYDGTQWPRSVWNVEQGPAQWGYWIKETQMRSRSHAQAHTHNTTHMLYTRMTDNGHASVITLEIIRKTIKWKHTKANKKSVNLQFWGKLPWYPQLKRTSVVI